MTPELRKLFEFLKTPFPYFFLVTSLAVSLTILTDQELAGQIQLAQPEPVAEKSPFVLHNNENEANFTIYAFDKGPDMTEIVGGFIKFFGILLSLPAILATILFLESLAIDYPQIQPATFEVIGQIAFIYFNLNSWLLLSYLIYTVHDRFLQNNPARKPALSIIPR